jgi:hypothetical protein
MVHELYFRKAFKNVLDLNPIPPTCTQYLLGQVPYPPWTIPSLGIETFIFLLSEVFFFSHLFNVYTYYLLKEELQSQGYTTGYAF